MKPRTATFLAVLLVAAACGRDEPKVAVGKPSPTPPAPVICPLNGEERTPGFDIGRPPLAVKIDNAVPARPQAGLENADIVYEELAEGGITRFLAIFHCNDSENIGPVRSARFVDPDILMEYTPVLFAYSGANTVVLQKVARTEGVVDLRHGRYGKAYRRVRGRPGPHDLFTSSDKMRELSDARGVPKSGLVFVSSATPAPKATSSPSPKNGRTSTPAPKATSSPSPKNGKTSTPATSPSPQPAPGASVTFSYAGSVSVKYNFDQVSGRYLRFHGEKPHLAEGGERLKVTNVVVLEVDVKEGTIKDAAGNVSPEISVVGSGEAIVLLGGTSKTVRWERKSLSDKMRLLNGAGQPLALAVGNTWIHLLPTDRPVTVS